MTECFPMHETLLRNVYFENKVQMLLHRWTRPWNIVETLAVYPAGGGFMVSLASTVPTVCIPHVRCKNQRYRSSFAQYASS